MGSHDARANSRVSRESSTGLATSPECCFGRKAAVVPKPPVGTQAIGPKGPGAGGLGGGAQGFSGGEKIPLRRRDSVIRPCERNP